MGKASGSEFLRSLLMLRPQLFVCLLPLLFCGGFDDFLSFSDSIHPLSLDKRPRINVIASVLSACSFK